MLLDAVERDLHDAGQRLSSGWRFAIAYTSALRLSSVALFASGYRAERDHKHYRTIAALPLVLGPDVAELAQFLDTCRSKRHEVTYESATAVSEAEADELIGAVDELSKRIREWLKAAHPDLI